ncbi:LacI family DNA-binding transcriptional regulator [Shewanella baltica]|jgi:alanine racemase|uniref:LacI family DNA-binding transcriptional regulator n=1 Tax=Shewanella baltica TaxID=62322 RepID=UPI000D3D10AC|nr:LacI family DNA-binding transcriptional regulator [Shewanella baltica]MCS6098914.1 LacI family transcriptional regulator [Shewanella baltica]MCS6113111.1 LacI family transcriptional regulator [Shewanella baltica]MCS6161310.1 LacI family transcriptional regulator [Shewanella baltica]MCS6182130.1 LacI family transcriptional regulator [Shewanella baltica]MCS6240749.1 LacI family transcriptional regulator [Shewanella baltica]
MASKATSIDIAYRAGVSQSTVSRALRNSPLVNLETRQRIQAIAKELNYKVDKNASNLRTQNSHTLALLLCEDPTNDDSLINPFFLSMLGSITRATAQQGYDLLVSFQQLSSDWHADYEDSNKADGIILLGYGDYMDYEQKLERLLAQNTHFVIWGAEHNNKSVLSIGCDNHQGGLIATEHLISLGRNAFAFLGDASSHSPEFRDRYLGHVKALQTANIPVDRTKQVSAISTESSGYDAAMVLIAQGAKFDAIFAASDLIAIGAIRALKEKGISVPEQVAVVGYDDIPVASFANPPLTTIKQNTQLAGEILVDSVLKLIRGQEVSAQLIPTTLVVRSSCGIDSAPLKPLSLA